jgi:hypothetical protein
MTMMRKFKTALFAAAFVLLGLGALEQMTSTGSYSVVSKAEARVGRPLTPVSGAGVARRTVRRCAAGVYNC